MKHILLFIFSALTLFPNAQQIPRCQIISNDHFGGNLSEIIEIFPGLIHYPDGGFGLPINTWSVTSTSMSTACEPQGKLMVRRYNADFTAMVSETCAPKPDVFADPTFFTFPQGDGGRVLIGYDNNQDFGIVKQDAQGNQLWYRHYGGSDNDHPAHAIPTPDGGFIIAAVTTSDDGDVCLHHGNTFTGDIWIIKIDSLGALVWSRVIGGSYVELLSQINLSPDGGCYLFGVTTSSDFDAIGNHGISDLYIVKLDSLGNKEWHRCYGGSDDDACSYDYGLHAAEDGQGGFYVVNRTASQDGDVQRRLPNPDGWDLWLLHIDAAGNILWENTYGTANDQVGVDIVMGSDHTLWVGGSITYYGPPSESLDAGYGSSDAWILHLDTLGNLINQRVIGNDAVTELRRLHALPDGSVLAIGYYRAAAGSNASPGFPLENEGDVDIFITRLGGKTVGINAPDAAIPEWSLHPNPADDKLHITIKETNHKTFRIGITDAAGKKIHDETYQKGHSINTKAWAAGTYFVRLTDNKGNSSMKKIIIHH